MNAAATPPAARSPSSVRNPLRAVLLREFRAALLNRYMQVFSALALAGGIAAVMLGEEPGAASVFLLQLALYFVSLFSMLAGVGSAQAEVEEWPILFSQPVPRPAVVLGKFLALVGIFSGVLAALFAPALFVEDSPGALARIYVQTLGLAAVFGSLGLCAGFVFGDRGRGLVAGVGAWLFLLLGVDLGALLVLQWPALQHMPDAWAAVVMLNPLDAFRIQALFALEQIPAESAGANPLANWWLAHSGWWLALLSAIWTTALLTLACRRLRRTEV